MKSKEEIEQLAKIITPTPMEGTSYLDVRNGFIKGYTQCQEDMALSQPKKLEPQKHIDSELVLELLSEFYRLKLRLDYPSEELNELYDLIKQLNKQD